MAKEASKEGRDGAEPFRPWGMRAVWLCVPKHMSPIP